MWLVTRALPPRSRLIMFRYNLFAKILRSVHHTHYQHRHISTDVTVSPRRGPRDLSTSKFSGATVQTIYESLMMRSTDRKSYNPKPKARDSPENLRGQVPSLFCEIRRTEQSSTKRLPKSLALGFTGIIVNQLDTKIPIIICAIKSSDVRRHASTTC